jgi:hypothetical protein
MGPPIRAPQRGVQRAALAQVEPAGSEQSTGGFNPHHIFTLKKGPRSQNNAFNKTIVRHNQLKPDLGFSS